MWIALPLFTLLSVASGIDIKANIPASLRECYNDSLITTRDNLLPFTVTTLISIIRKLEDSVTGDMRVLTPAILHRYRFDGILRNPEIHWTQDVIPFSPSGSEFFLYKLLFERLIPSTQPIPNNTLTYKERCTLHAMLSSSVDPWDRGDNSESCSKISKYTSSDSWDWGGNRFRFPRDLAKLGDAEVFDPKVGPAALEENTQDMPQSEKYMALPQSQCPLESGVIYHKYGTLSPGIVLAGITTGLQQENVAVRNLINIAPRLRKQPTFKPSYGRPPYDRSPPYGDRAPSYGDRPSYGGSVYTGSRVNQGNGGGYLGDYTIDNRHAATFAGVLGEVSLLLGPSMETQHGGLKIGMSGGWNDTAIPKYYFIRDYLKDALSDSKLRGGIDGLLLAKEVKKWSDSTSGSLKLSQVLGMYYSEKGLFGTNIRACSRRDHLSEIAPDTEIKDQATAFAAVLQDNLPESVSISPEGIQRYTSIATDDAFQYIGSSMSETCPPNSNPPLIQSPSVDLHVVIDSNFDYREISKIITYLADNMEINKYSSNFSLINGFDGTVLIESSQTPLDVSTNFTLDTYRTLRRGFDFDKILSVIRERFKDKLRYDSLTSTGGGNPRVVLFIPQASANINNQNILVDKIRTLKTRVPDVKLIYLLLSGTKEKFRAYADDPDQDIFTVSAFSDIAQALDPVIKRISSVPKRIINPKCGATWTPNAWYSTATIRGFLEKPEVHYYRVHPNYFYRETNAKITIRNEDHSQSITVCSSRQLEQPVVNYTRPSRYTEANCKSLSGGQESNVYISSNDCTASYAIDCQPYYISVSTSQNAIIQMSNIVSCTDADCKYPDMLKYTINHQGLGCYSGVGRILGAPIIILLFITVNFLR